MKNTALTWYEKEVLHNFVSCIYLDIENEEQAINNPIDYQTITEDNRNFKDAFVDLVDKGFCGTDGKRFHESMVWITKEGFEAFKNK